MTLPRTGDRLLVPGHVVARVMPDVTLLLNTQTGSYFSLDEVGSRAWTLVTTLGSRQAVHDALVEAYDVTSDDLGADLDALLTQLMDAGLLEPGRE